MPIIRFQPSGKSIKVPTGTVLLDAARQLDLEIQSPCGADGTCGKCAVKIVEGRPAEAGSTALTREAIQEGYVQACISQVSESDIVVEIPAGPGKRGQFADAASDFKRIPPDRFPQAWERHPLVTVDLLSVPQPLPNDGLSDLDRLTAEIQKKYGSKAVICSLERLRLLAECLRGDNGNLSLTLSHSEHQIAIHALHSGTTATPCYGAAIDLGTTTVSVQLVSILDGEILVTRTGYNLQLSCGADIISRINYARRADRLEELRVLALKSIHQLLDEAVAAGEIESSEQILSAVISGNTTMVHLLLGLNPDYIRLDPYTPTALEVPVLQAFEIGLEISSQAPVFVSPAVGSYVGGDITAGLLCSNLVDRSDEISLFLDIGTNGELAIGNQEFVIACACSAGPAFEGGAIDCGMRATRGAIEAVIIDKESGKAQVKTIGSSKAKGICGSGIISLLAGLFKSGWLDPSGKLSRARSCSCIELQGRQARYIIVPASESNTGKPVSISEAEIDNVIRAKAAIYSACTLLVNQVGVDFSAIRTFHIAGGFGHYLNLEECITIGLLPDIPRDTYQFLGNTSLIGSYMLLLSRDIQSRQKELARRITYLDLGNDPDYMEQYTAALFLPHTDASQFPSAE